jgi:hypothetical protein
MGRQRGSALPSFSGTELQDGLGISHNSCLAGACVSPLIAVVTVFSIPQTSRSEKKIDPVFLPSLADLRCLLRKAFN